MHSSVTRSLFWVLWGLTGAPFIKLAEKFAFVLPLRGLKYVVLRDHISIISGALMGFVWACFFILFSSIDGSSTCTVYASLTTYFLAHVIVLIVTTAFRVPLYAIEAQFPNVQRFLGLYSETLGGYIGYLIGLAYCFSDVVLPGKSKGSNVYIPGPIDEWCHPGWRFTAFSWAIFVFFISIPIAFAGLKPNDTDRTMLDLAAEMYADAKRANDELRLMRDTRLSHGMELELEPTDP